MNSSGQVEEGQEGSDQVGLPILVMNDMLKARGGTGHVFARVVPNKGVNEYAVQAVAQQVAQLGHKELIMKSDGEPAIQALKAAVKAERPERIILEQSPVAESKSNGQAENAVQQIQGQFRAGTILRAASERGSQESHT